MIYNAYNAMRGMLARMLLAGSLMTGCTIGGNYQFPTPGELLFPDAFSFPDASSPADAGHVPGPVVRTDCGGTLVDLLSDDANCGACGNACDVGTTCYDSTCRFPSYLDEPCGPEGWCPTSDMACVTFDSGNYCVDRLRRGCEFHDACDQAERRRCIGDECVVEREACFGMYCSPFSEELCDSRDNDRNGIVDDVPPRPCYTGPEGTRGVGLCRSGVELCQNGAWMACTGERHPVVEEHILLCDGRDNDCDGCADNTYDAMGDCMDPAPKKYDIISIIDLSGSMSDEIIAVSAASLEFASAFDGDPNFRFALVGHPFAEWEPMSRMLELPLSDYSVFRGSLAGFISLAFIGGSLITGAEQNYDAPYLVASDAFPEIGFRPDARRVYINFTDEEGQSYPYSGWPAVDESLMCSAFREDDVVVFVTHPYLFSYFDECAINFALRNTPSEMVSDLQSIFTAVCDNRGR